MRDRHSYIDSQPPKNGERLLSFFLHPADREVLLGDFEEEYSRIARERGIAKARVSYWLQILKSIPYLVILAGIKYQRSMMMAKHSFLEKNKSLAIAGLVLSIPAFLLCFGGILQSGFGITGVNNALNFNLWIFRPLILMGGLILALLLNLLPVIQIKFEDGHLVGIINLRGRLMNVGFIALGLLLSATILLYLLAENFGSGQ